MALRVAIDIGGGFVDLAAIDLETGTMYWAKSFTTPDDLTRCVREVFRQSGLDPAAVVQLMHGQTLVINAILQRTGAKVGLLTTRGFRDILALQRANRRDIFNLRYRKPEPLVPRNLRREVDERISARGDVLTGLDEASLLASFEHLVAQGVEAVAICYLNSYANDVHERRSVQLLESHCDRHPELPRPRITCSSDVCREWREYERTSTAVLNAYVMPQLERYTGTLRRELRDLGIPGTLYMMLSNGGVASFEYAERCPIETVESGPVAGIVAAAQVGTWIERPNLIALDGGSTTTKASLIHDGRIRYQSEYAVERDDHRPGYPIKVPVADVMEIGVGGNSLAWIDDGGRLCVGPRNAGAVAGPAAYGRGGIEPTLTDAFLALGFLHPEYLLGGALKVSRELALQAVARIAEPLGVGVLDAALGIVRIAVHSAVQMLRLISVQRGYDPREFSLLAYGGSGPMLAALMAQELEVRDTVISAIPPGNFSAWGLLMCDLKQTAVRTSICSIASLAAAERLQHLYDSLESEVAARFAEGKQRAPVHLERAADLRYAGQEHTIRIVLPSSPIDAELLAALDKLFRDAHRKEFGFALSLPLEFVNGIVTGIASVGKPTTMQPAKGAPSPLSVETSREVYWGAHHQGMTRVVPRSSLVAGVTVQGPAVIEETTTSTLVPPGTVAVVDEFLNLVLRNQESPDQVSQNQVLREVIR